MVVDAWRRELFAGALAVLVPLFLAACGTTAAPTATPAPEPPVAIVPAIATPDPDYVPPKTPWRPAPYPGGEREGARAEDAPRTNDDRVRSKKSTLLFATSRE